MKIKPSEQETTMKTKSYNPSTYLNLYNYDDLSAKDCPYILTSPRSLEACRRAGCKPVELLHKSLQEYQEELGPVQTEVYQLYISYEQDRLKKLEKCRMIRRELVAQNIIGTKENSPPPRIIYAVKNKDKVHKKNYLSKEKLKSSESEGLKDNVPESEDCSNINEERKEFALVGPNPISLCQKDNWNPVLHLKGGCDENSSITTLRPLHSEKKKRKCCSARTKPRSTRFKNTSNSLMSRRSYLSSDNLCLSEHDRRILESMALKKKLEHDNDEFAHHAHLLWERDREEREQLNNELSQQWKVYISEKRKLENAENTRKWEEMKQNLRKSQTDLERSIKEKGERTSNLKKTLQERKLSEANERSVLAAKHRAEVEAACQQLELETVLWQHTLDQKQRERQERAESTRRYHKDTYRRRVASANRVEELRHQEKLQQVKDDTERSLKELQHFCQMREQHAQEKYTKLIKNRDKHIKGQSLERAIKFQHVQQLHDELESGLKKWQKQVLTFQWESAERAEHKVTRQLESKRFKVESENRARQHHHYKLMERINQEDEARIKCVREIICRKEQKMKKMAQERDLAIRESRQQAQMTANLREHLRCTLSPETFDRKVARVEFETRVAGRPPTASPPMTRSHIYLG